MIAFATLWLGLVTGAVPVELLAGPDVARVELRLDGAPCAAIAAPPWQASCDLGPEIAPHELVAVAFDGGGRQLAEARQWLNLPRDPAELEVALSTEPGPPPKLVARLAWAGPGGAAPLAVSATLDDEPLSFTAGWDRLVLPPLQPGAAKLLRVEALFPGGTKAGRELAVGGDLAEQIAQELTGVPVELLGRADRAALSDGERQLRVVAFEKGRADLVVVVDPAATAALAKLAREGGKQRVSRGGIGLGPRSSPGAGTMAADARAKVPVPEGARMRLVWPVAESRQHGELRFDLFPTSPERTAADGSLLDALGLATLLPGSTVAPRIADAVALAALTAAEPGRRRAVLLVLGEQPLDTSTYDAARVRRFLDRLRVPLVVWSTATSTPEMVAVWGKAETIASVQRLESAAKHLDQLLGRQRIAWVEGRHLPQRLVAGAGGALRLATTEPAAEAIAADATQPAASAAAGNLTAEDEAALSSTTTLDDAATLDSAARDSAALESTALDNTASLDDAPDPDDAPSAATQSAAAASIVDPVTPAIPIEVTPGAVDASFASKPPALPSNFPLRSLPPFMLFTDVHDERLLATLGEVAAAVPADFGARFGLRPRAKGSLVLFAQSLDFRQWLDQQGGGGDHAVEGFSRAGVAALAVGDLRDDDVSALLVHELAHLLTRAAVGRQLPPWLEEGLAEEMSISRRDTAGRTLAGTLRARSSLRNTAAIPTPGRVMYERTISGPAAALVALVRGPRPALAELVPMPWSSFSAARGRAERYAASAFFVRYLLDGDKGRWREPFLAFLAAAATGAPADVAALERALGTPIASLQDPFDQWLRRTAVMAR